MKLKILDNKGFSTVTLLVLILGLGLIGTVIWFVYNQQDENNANYSQTTTQNNDKEMSGEKATEENKESSEQPLKTTTLQHVSGTTFELPNSMGSLLTWSRTSEVSSLSSSTLLSKEKELYGDTVLHCRANDYALGSITVKDSSSPFPGDSLIKKLDSGKYLFYSDSAHDSFCYKDRSKLRSLVDEQVQHLKEALKTAK